MLVQMPLWGAIVLGGFSMVGVLAIAAVIAVVSKGKRK